MTDDKNIPPINPKAGPMGKWERELVQKLVFASLNEQRRTRRWNIFFKFILFGYLIGLLLLWMPDEIPGFDSVKTSDKHTALVEVKGVIMDDSEASADSVISGLREAFEDDKTKGVILRINTPGGSAVQSGYINDEIKRLKEKHEDIPVYAVVTDMCASGGYYIAAAADKIYVDKASIVGSIGVLMNGFGFVDGMEMLGVERRLMTAGEHKGIMDPFSPVKEEEREHMQLLLDKIHQQFIDTVKAGRGDRLKDDEKLFSGLFWTGEESVELGLADGIGSSSYVARELIGAEDIVDFTPAEDLLDRLARRVGVGAASTFSNTLGIGSVPNLAR
ncbi:MAG: signal peptide peptidase SppA [Candidatus Sedimenticola sp. 20ELBAFRAG]